MVTRYAGITEIFVLLDNKQGRVGWGGGQQVCWLGGKEMDLVMELPTEGPHPKALTNLIVLLSALKGPVH